jgi:hypothetical protein
MQDTIVQVKKEATTADHGHVWRCYAVLFLVIYLPMNILYLVGTIEKRDLIFHECEDPSAAFWCFRLATSTLVVCSLLYSFRACTKYSIALSVTLMVLFCSTWFLILNGCSLDGDYYVQFNGIAGGASYFDYYFHYISFIIGMCVLGLCCIGAAIRGICSAA